MPSFADLHPEWRRAQERRMLEAALSPSLISRLYPIKKKPPLSAIERLRRAIEQRRQRLQDALKVLRGEAEIREDDE